MFAPINDLLCKNHPCNSFEKNLVFFLHSCKPKQQYTLTNIYGDTIRPTGKHALIVLYVTKSITSGSFKISFLKTNCKELLLEERLSSLPSFSGFADSHSDT